MRALNPLRRFRPKATCWRRTNYENVLGTSFEIQILAGRDEDAIRAEESARNTVDRLEKVFSQYDSESEFRRWQTTHGIDAPVSHELATVLAEAEAWRGSTRNAFCPTQSPGNDPLWTVDIERRTACRYTDRPASLNAIAKGYIIDRACEAAHGSPGVEEVILNIGGDVRHMGKRMLRAAVANPFTGADNDSIATICIQNRGMATSGSYRRGPHLVDPRSGIACEHIASVSVVADDAMTADVLSTAFSVLAPEESLEIAEALPGVGIFLVLADGVRHSNRIWNDLSEI